VDSSSSVSVGGTSTFGGLATFSGGIKTTSLAVDQDATVGGKLTVTGLTTLSGGAKITGGTTTDTLTVTGGATISNNLTVTSGTTVSMGGNRVQNVGTPVLGTDAANKAYVDTSINTLGSSLNTLSSSLNQRIDDANHRIDKAFDGTAIALALATPIFQPGQKFVIQGGWGNFEGSNAVGFSAAGLLSRDTFGRGSTVTLSGGIGGGTNTGTVGGRGAVSIGW
jgi:trimeric autotransporter adhesin